jgi:hypothetical protein
VIYFPLPDAALRGRAMMTALIGIVLVAAAILG